MIYVSRLAAMHCVSWIVRSVQHFCCVKRKLVDCMFYSFTVPEYGGVIIKQFHF